MRGCWRFMTSTNNLGYPDTTSKNSLSIKPVGEIDAEFLIPDYQRGYRWEKINIIQLLEDLYHFSESKEAGNTYFLQPVVVKKLGQNKYEVIDGQQRLTTLFLLGKVLGRNEEDPLRLNYRLEYQTSGNLGVFLEKLTGKDAEISEEEYKATPNKYYMYQAYNTINDWFDEKAVPGLYKSKIRALLQPLSEESTDRKLAKVIWYETESEKPENEFRKLNDYAIKLTNAELIKALILRFKKNPDIDENKEQIITSAQWDTIEKQLSNPNFFGFLTNENLDSYETKIDLLFELYFDKGHHSYNKYETLQEVENELKNKTELDFWRDVYHSFEIINSWFNDKTMYHKIGYLVSTSSKKSLLPELLKKSRKEKHSVFEGQLDDLIRDSIKNFEFENASYGDKAIKNVLILYNMVLILENENNNNQFPFYLLKTKQWDIEHIQPRSNAEFINNRDLYTDWIEKNIGEDEKMLPEYHSYIESERTNKQIRASFEALYEKVVGRYSDNNMDWINGIGNLCLLEKGSNVAVSNYLFKVKQQMIMNFDKMGDFVPLGTKNCFMRYFEYNEDDKNRPFWNSQDRHAYIEDIKRTLVNYLPSEKVEEKMESKEDGL